MRFLCIGVMLFFSVEVNAMEQQDGAFNREIYEFIEGLGATKKEAQETAIFQNICKDDLSDHESIQSEDDIGDSLTDLALSGVALMIGITACWELKSRLMPLAQ